MNNLKKLFLTIFSLFLVLVLLVVPVYATNQNSILPDDASDRAKVVVNNPPSKFNPLEASNKELKDYGFPEKPSNKEELLAWKEAMSHATNFVIPEFMETNINHESAQISNASYTSNWSGQMAVPPSGQSFTKVTANFIVPSVSISDRESYSSTWIGLGGFYTNKLIQAGTAQHKLSSGATQYYTWWEILPDPEQRITNIAVYPGDKFYVHISWDSSRSSATFFIENVTRSQYSSFSTSFTTSSDYDGSSAEWIVERPSVGGRISPLARFGTVDFTSSYAGTPSSSLSLGDWGHAKIIMSQNGTILADPASLLSNLSFRATWKNYGSWQ